MSRRFIAWDPAQYGSGLIFCRNHTVMTLPKLPVPDQSRNAQIMWSSFVAVVLLCGLAVVTSEPSGAVEPDKWEPTLIGAALILAVGSICWRWGAMRSARLSASQRSHDDNLKRLQTIYLTTWVLSEGVAIAGLVLARQTGALETYAPFGVCALVLLVAHRPNRFAWEGP